MKILVIVNDSPWGSTLAVTALRLARALLTDDLLVDAVYFRGEGVYNAIAGRAADNGTPVLADAWRLLSESRGIPLLLCSSAAQRRLDCAPADGFREAGLAEVLERMAACDRVLSF